MKTDAWDRALFHRGAIGPLLGTIGLCLVLGVGWGLLAAGVHAFMYVFVLSSSINGLCHHVGYKNFANTATNIRFVAWLTGGEGLHNNHHGFPRSPKFSVKRSEFDPAWPVIRLLTALKLARPYKTIDAALSSTNSLSCSLELCHSDDPRDHPLPNSGLKAWGGSAVAFGAVAGAARAPRADPPRRPDPPAGRCRREAPAIARRHRARRRGYPAR